MSFVTQTRESHRRQRYLSKWSQGSLASYIIMPVNTTSQLMRHVVVHANQMTCRSQIACNTTGNTINGINVVAKKATLSSFHFVFSQMMTFNDNYEGRHARRLRRQSSSDKTAGKRSRQNQRYYLLMVHVKSVVNMRMARHVSVVRKSQSRIECVSDSVFSWFSSRKNMLESLGAWLVLSSSWIRDVSHVLRFLMFLNDYVLTDPLFLSVGLFVFGFPASQPFFLQVDAHNHDNTWYLQLEEEDET